MLNEVKVFDKVQYDKIVKLISKRFDLETDLETDLLNPKRFDIKDFIISHDFTMLIVAKSDLFKDIIKNFVTSDSVENITLDYSQIEIKPIISRYQLENLDFIIKLCKLVKPYAVDLQLKTDYPLTLECDDFKLILAPAMRE